MAEKTRRVDHCDEIEEQQEKTARQQNFFSGSVSRLFGQHPTDSSDDQQFAWPSGRG